MRMVTGTVLALALVTAQAWSASGSEALDRLATNLGGHGRVLVHGEVVETWGDQTTRYDWLSAAKPVLSTLLFFAIDEGRVKGVDEPIADVGWDLQGKDRGITYRNLGAMNSGYARPEGPGEVWAYNDFAIMLYQATLFDKVFKADPQSVSDAPERLGALGLEDGLEWRKGNRRLKASVRDFAKIAQFWLQRGSWNRAQVLPAHYFDDYMKPQTDPNLPQTEKADTDDYLGIGTYGGGSDHFTKYGAGIYGFNWWFNSTGRLHPDALTWPDAPKDTIMAIGFGGNCAALFPGLDAVVVCAKGDWGNLEGGNRESRLNRMLALAAEGIGQHATTREDVVTGERKQWHPVTLSFRGPEAAETGDPNPFTEYRLTVTLKSGDETVVVPGYFAADGDAGESSATSGDVWRAHFTPHLTGTWTYRAELRRGEDVALRLEPEAGEPVPLDDAEGSFTIAPSNKQAPDVRARGLLQYVGERYLKYAGTGEYYLKGGADSPENFLAYYEIDGTKPSHRYEPHAGDWHDGDPTWQGGKGKNIVGALNYLAGKGMNVVYFLTMNVKGDGKDVWPWTSDNERFRFDCSKLDQWNVIFDHMDRLGIVLHVVLQEQENDQLLDGGDLGRERKMYFRELVARFAHHPALLLNLCEENTNTTEQHRAFSDYLHALDPYGHPIVLHTFPKQYDKVYRPLMNDDTLEGLSLQMGDMTDTHEETLKWVRETAGTPRPWVVFLDEIGPAQVGVAPDNVDPGHDKVRIHALWGNLMAGGAGAEWLFGYDNPHTDIDCEDWRSRDAMWDQTRYALEFFQDHLPFTEMAPADDRILDGEAWCFAQPGKIYAVYLLHGGSARVNTGEGAFDLAWYNPRQGGPLIPGGARTAQDGALETGPPPSQPGQDWAALLIRREE